MSDTSSRNYAMQGEQLSLSEQYAYPAVILQLSGVQYDTLVNKVLAMFIIPSCEIGLLNYSCEFNPQYP